ncbi:hypothetical protein ABZ585_28905, partial [Streptomyces vietnamensis]
MAAVVLTGAVVGAAPVRTCRRRRGGRVRTGPDRSGPQRYGARLSVDRKAARVWLDDAEVAL